MRSFRAKLLHPVCRLPTTLAPRLHRPPPPGLTASCPSTYRRIANRSPLDPSAISLRRQETLAQHPYSSEKLQLPLGAPLQAGASYTLLVLATLSAAVAVYATLQSSPAEQAAEQTGKTGKTGADEQVVMTEIKYEELPGRVGNLTPDQEQKVRELWAALFRVCAVGDPEGEPDDAASTAPSDGLADKSTNAKEKPKKRRITMFSRKGHKDNKHGDSDSASAASGVTDDADDKYGQNKQFLETLANTSPETLRATVWSMVKHDHPDALILRFLRARKWDVNKALVMLVSTMHWRATEMHLDDEIMQNGEGQMVELSKSDDPKKKQLADDFMAQIRMGKSFLHGLDDKGRPICVVRVRCHHQGEQCEESLERYTVYLIETARMVLRPPVDTATVLFDMTGFSMANMDYTPLKFMIKCFEANYPESLGSVLVHKAPWIFQGIWKVIRGWLDPVVASKVHFTNNIKDLEEYIDASRVPKELDGAEDYEYKYMEPVAGENDKMNDTTTRDGLLTARDQLYHDYEEATAKWIKSPEDAAIKAQRDSIAAKLRVDYWNLDVYVRARSLYDRTGWIQGEKVEPYPTKKDVAVQAGENGVGTSSDDVD